MSLPNSDPNLEENETLGPARQRRRRRALLPQESGERAEFLRGLARRTVPSFDFFLFSLLAGLTLSIAMLLDAPALFLLAALLAPFMAPAVAMALGTVGGTGRFILQSLGSLSIGSLIVFLCGTIAGWAATLLPEQGYLQVGLYSRFTWPYFLVLVIGAALTAYLLVRAPQQKPLVSSVALAYGLYLPVGAAGFGLISGVGGLWPAGLFLFLVHLSWAVIVGVLVLAVLGLRPLSAAGYLLSGAYGLIGVAALSMILPQQPVPTLVISPTETSITEGVAVLQPTSTTSTISPSPSPSSTATVTPSITPTRTLVPSRTATVTNTPSPTPVWARISAVEGGGALVREKPEYGAVVVQSVLNETLVEVLPEVVDSGGVAWVHVRLVSGKEGWIVRSLLRTATPAPDW